MKKLLLILILCSCCFAAWDNDNPADTTDYDDGVGEIRDNWDALEAVFGVDLADANTGYYEVFNVKSSAYGAEGDGDGAGGGTDDTAAIQAAIDAAIAVKGAVYLPPGTYLISDTLLLGRGSGTFDTVSMYGSAKVAEGVGTLIDATGFLDRPAINIQGARGIELANIAIIGGNIAPTTADGGSDTESDYLTSGVTYAQYNPYCGVSIDAYSGSDPGATGYPGTYGKNLSSGIRLTNVAIKNFVIGVTNHPCNSNSQGDDVVLDMVRIDDCAYGFGVHGTQNRGNYLRNCEINSVRTAIITGKYGPQSGIAPKIEGGVWSKPYRFFNVGNTRDLLSVDDLYVEGFMTMGNLGAGTANAMKPASFEGCLFVQRRTGDLSDLPPIITFASYTPTVFNGCRFETQAGIFNIVGEDIVFNSCNWRASDTWNDQMYIGHSFIVATPPIDMTGCTYNTDLYGQPTSTINSMGYIASLATPERLVFTPASRFAVDASGTYKYVRGSTTNYVSSAITSVSWSDADTATFTATTVAEFAEDDILFWKSAAQTNLSDTKYELPAMKITDITGSVVTVDVLYDDGDYDKTWAPTTAYIVQREWAPGTTCTGNTTSGNADITGVAGVGCIKVGDFIKGTGIASNARVTTIVSTTVTMSKNATATSANTDLYFAQVIPLGTTITKTVEITSAQIKLLATTSQTLVAAQGADTLIEFISALLIHDAGAAYAEPSAPDDLVIEYDDGDDVSQEIDATNFLDQTVDEIRFVNSLTPAADPTTTDLADNKNDSLMLTNTGADYTTGTGTMTVIITYRVHTLGL